LPAWIHPDRAKARKGIAVPLNDTAVGPVRAQKAKQPTRVLTCESKPIRQLSTRAWYKAPKRTGIEDFRWHDLRHTRASWHVPSGTPLFALQELAGLVTEKTMPATWKVNGTNTAQLPDFCRTAWIASIWKIKNLIWPGMELNHRHADLQSGAKISIKS